MFLFLIGSILTFVSVLFAILYQFYQIKFQYWEKQKIKYLPPSFPFGNLRDANIKRHISEVLRELYNETKHEPFMGAYFLFNPGLFINDPELIKTIFVKEFASFHDRGVFVDEKNDPLAAHLFAMSGAEWKNMRVKLTPTFTSGKMKMMFPTMREIGIELREALKEFADEQSVIDMRDWTSRFTTDVIASCAFGIDTNSLKDPECKFRNMGRKVFNLSKFETLKMSINFITPKVAKFLKLRMVSREVEKFFLTMVRDTIETRETKNIQRKDFMQLLIELKNKGYLEDAETGRKQKEIEVETRDAQKFTINQAAAQAFVFFVAGFETSSTAMQFALYALALNPDIQRKVRDEIDFVLNKYDGILTYEGIMEMEYLGRVISETLRMYSPVPAMSRVCSKKYEIPGTNVVIEEGVSVIASFVGLHNDPRYFPEPEKFDPDRFTEKEKAKRPHYTYMPFGEGPRICIGSRFALMQMKVGLVAILCAYQVQVCDQTLIPMEVDPKSSFVAPKGGLYLRIKDRNCAELRRQSSLK